MIKTFKKSKGGKRRSVTPTRKVSKGGARVKGGRVSYPIKYFGGIDKSNLLNNNNNKIIVIKGGKRRRRPRRSSKRSKRR